MMPADPDLVRAAQGGDRRAMETLLNHQYGRVYAVCRRIVGNDADAADAAQEAMIAVVRGLHRFDGRAAFSTWVYRIATNASLDELRRRRRRATVDIDDQRFPEQADDGAVSHLDAVGQRVELDAALAALPLDFRTAVVLRDVADLDYDEIAATLAIPVGTVKSRIARGRAALASSLGKWDGNPPTSSERPTGER